MASFELSKNIKVKPEEIALDQSMSILEFQKRILDIADLDCTPLMEKMNYLKIIDSNIKEFLSIRMPSIISKWYNIYLEFISSLYKEMNKIYDKIYTPLLEKSNFKDSLPHDAGNYTISSLHSGIVYIAYLVNNTLENKWIINIMNHSNPVNIAPEYKSYFIFKLDGDESIKYDLNGNSIKKQLKDIDDMSQAKDNKVFHFIIASANKIVVEKALDNLNIKIRDIITAPENIINIKANIYELENHNEMNGCQHKYLPDYFYYQKMNYENAYKNSCILNELNNKNIVIRTPYQSYDTVLQFINECCLDPAIHNIFITLYRTADNSKIVESLEMAAKLKKNVYAYVETLARGNERHNTKIAKTLKDAGVHVQDSFKGFKIHAKAFLAIRETEQHVDVYSHIGTGNYNEDTAKIYADTHILTSDRPTGYSILNMFKMIFSKENFSLEESNNLFLSPFNSRSEIINAMQEEIDKGDKGQIYLKCNSLCDTLVIETLKRAAKASVDIGLIVRTGLSILPNKNIHVRSKVGRYLEHDRIYLIGDKAYIGSADLLFRNLDKRIECIYKVNDVNTKVWLRNTFYNIWCGGNIHMLNPETLNWEYLD